MQRKEFLKISGGLALAGLATNSGLASISLDEKKIKSLI